MQPRAYHRYFLVAFAVLAVPWDALLASTGCELIMSVDRSKIPSGDDSSPPGDMSDAEPPADATVPVEAGTPVES